MTYEEFQRWLGAHGQAVLADGIPGPQTRAATIAAFSNSCADQVTPPEIDVLAGRLGCTSKQLRAVATVESGGSAFDRYGRPRILFERHLFHRFTGGRWLGPFSDPEAGGYGEDSWEKLAMAAARDVEAAFASVSWGKFQVLGAHANGSRSGFLNLGYPSALEMAYSTVTGEAAHYDMLVRYIEKAGLRRALAQLSANPRDNVPFAKGYNGPAFHRFAYHDKLARAML